MIVGQLIGLESAPAVLAMVAVPGIDVTPRESDSVMVVLDPHVAQQPENCRQANRHRYTANLLIVLFHHLDLVLEQHPQGTLP